MGKLALVPQREEVPGLEHRTQRARSQSRECLQRVMGRVRGTLRGYLLSPCCGTKVGVSAHYSVYNSTMFAALHEAQYGFVWPTGHLTRG